MITEKDIEQVYLHLRVALNDHARKAEAAVKTKTEWETVKSQGLILKDEEGKPLIQGKNVAERDAKAKELYAVQYQSYLISDQELGYTKHELDMARLKVEEVRLKVRLMEILPQEIEGPEVNPF